MIKIIIFFVVLVVTSAGVVFGWPAITALDSNIKKSPSYPQERIENPDFKKPTDPVSSDDLFYVPDTFLIYLYS